MTEVYTEIEPPLPEEDEDDEESRLHLYFSIVEGDEVRRMAGATLDLDASNDDLAEAIIDVALGAAAMRDPVLADRVRAKLL